MYRHTYRRRSCEDIFNLKKLKPKYFYTNFIEENAMSSFVWKQKVL